MKTPLTIVLLCASLFGMAQRQYPDSAYVPPAFKPRFSHPAPVVFIDEGHHNFHTRTGRYMAFTKVLEQDGLKVKPLSETFTTKNLQKCDILVIANAVPKSSTKKWVAPTASAFTQKEIAAVEQWVKNGGRLFLIADHMPMGGAAKELAGAFDFKFYDSFADDEGTPSRTEIFKKSNNSLAQNALTMESDHFFKVDSIATFTGQAFEIPEHATSILNCHEGWVSYLTKVAWRFDETTPKLNSAGWSQGAFANHGQGKLVVFGEAAMFSAQIAEIQGYKIKPGMNNKKAKDNYKLLVNIMRWLSM